MSAAMTRPLPMDSTTLLDCTIRDGSYAVDFQFDETFVAHLLMELDSSPIELIEIGHGIGIEAETTGAPAGNVALARWVDIATATIRRSSWGMFAQPGFTQVETISQLAEQGMSFVRVGMEAEKVPAQLGYLRDVAEVCGSVYLNLMKTGATPIETLPGLLSGLDPRLAGIYVVDSFGAMFPQDVVDYVETVAQFTDTVGFHGHNNLGLANVNSITALQNGAAVADGTLNGIGRGAGNAELESLAGIISRLAQDAFDHEHLARLAELCRANLAVVADNREMQALGGVIGVHSGFFPLIESLAAEIDVPVAALMREADAQADTSADPDSIRAAARTLAGSAPLTLSA